MNHRQWKKRFKKIHGRQEESSQVYKVIHAGSLRSGKVSERSYSESSRADWEGADCVCRQTGKSLCTDRRDDGRKRRMNRRQKMKRLKSQNKLMRDIIRDSADMERVYHLWMDGLEIKQTTIPIEEYKCERIIPPSFAHNDKYIEIESRLVVTDLLDGLRDYVSIEVQDLGWEKVIHGSILVGKVR